MVRRDLIVLRLREMILSGELAPNQRVAEIPMAERLGVSRTPVRHALTLLAREGLVVEAGARGYIVREFTLKEIFDAIELRGVLEGMAARLVAEARGAEESVRDLEDCLREGEAIIGRGRIAQGDNARWAAMNRRFHALIVEGCGNRALVNALSLNDHLPFASAGSVFAGKSPDRETMRNQYEVLFHAQAQHRAIFETLRDGQGARAEALMREHALALKYSIARVRGPLPPLHAVASWITGANPTP